MRTTLSFVAAALLATTAFSTPADYMLTQKKHTDAYSMGPKEMPAKDVTVVTWVGADHMRIEDEDKVIIVRLDTKKLYILDAKAKTSSSLDLPVDLKKYMPPEMAGVADSMPKPKCTVTVSDEKKKIKDWNTTKVVLEMASPMGKGGSKQEMWVTKDLPLDLGTYRDMWSTLATTRPGGSSIADEMKKIDGIPVVIDRTENRGPADVKSHEELVSIEKKDAPAGAFDVPKDYKDKPFDPFQGGMGPGHKGKPAEKPAPPGKEDPK